MHVPKDERSKLDSKTCQCIFVGYGQDEFGYRLYDPVKKKLLRSRDMIFVEDQTIDDTEKAQKTTSPSGNDLVDLDLTPLTSTPAPVRKDM